MIKGLQRQGRQGKDPRDARVLLAGLPKSGKTTLVSQWAPESTLIIDTHNGSLLLEGEHYVQHVKTWEEFTTLVKALTEVPPEGLRTIALDHVGDLFRFADLEVAKKTSADTCAAVNDFGRSMATAVSAFTSEIGKLLGTSLGIWFLTHTEAVKDEQIVRHVPLLSKQVRPYVEAVTDFNFLAEAIGGKRILHTAATSKFSAGGRCTLPEPMPMDAALLYKLMAEGLAADSPKTKETT